MTKRQRERDRKIDRKIDRKSDRKSDRERKRGEKPCNQYQLVLISMFRKSMLPSGM